MNSRILREDLKFKAGPEIKGEDLKLKQGLKL